ncbi:MAG: fasciclin domain-containing protein [Bacteroidota bacterium]
MIAVEGTDATNVAELNTNNLGLTLQEGTRYRFVNLSGTAHPLEFSNANGDALVQALSRFDDLVQTLNGAGSFTVFAPTNDAFTEFIEANGFALSTTGEVPIR